MRKGTALSTADVAEFLSRLPSLDTEVDDAQRIDQLGLLESVKAAAAAAQARVTAAFAASREAAEATAGVPPRERGRGVAAQVALARHASPYHGSRHLGLAKALVYELPHTMEHLSGGRVSEWRATIVARETACLSVADRCAVDAALSDDLPMLGDRAVKSRARAMAARLDPESVVARAAKATADRRVTLRPAPDTMTYLTALLPVVEGVAAHAALRQAATSLRAQGDDRTDGQVMADTLVQRVTGLETADRVPLDVHVVVSETALHGTSDEPGTIAREVVPAETLRRLVSRAALQGTPVTTRRVVTSADGCDVLAVQGSVQAAAQASVQAAAQASVQAAAHREGTDAVNAESLLSEAVPSEAVPSEAVMGSAGRFVRGRLRRTVLVRDQRCRTPWCDAPIRHADHVVPAARGGATTAANVEGLCEACNYTKESPGWSAEVIRGSPHTVRLTTPTGHTYHSTAPPVLPGRKRTADGATRAEDRTASRRTA